MKKQSLFLCIIAFYEHWCVEAFYCLQPYRFGKKP